MGTLGGSPSPTPRRSVAQFEEPQEVSAFGLLRFTVITVPTRQHVAFLHDVIQPKILLASREDKGLTQTEKRYAQQAFCKDGHERYGSHKFVCEQNIQRYEKILRTPLTE